MAKLKQNYIFVFKVTISFTNYLIKKYPSPFGMNCYPIRTIAYKYTVHTIALNY